MIEKTRIQRLTDLMSSQLAESDTFDAALQDKDLVALGECVLIALESGVKKHIAYRDSEIKKLKSKFANAGRKSGAHLGSEMSNHGFARSEVIAACMEYNIKYYEG